MIMLNNNLKVFIAVAESGSLTDAAKKLYISQPAVSQAIKKVEDELEVKLFIRNKQNKLILTDVGKTILSIAYKIADLENRLYQTAYETNHMMAGTIRIATVPLGASLILSHILPMFKKQFPKVLVQLMEGNPYEVKKMVLDYQADLGISTSPYMGLDHKTLLKDQMISISRDKKENIDLTKDTSDLVLCKVARDSLIEQLADKNIDLSHCLLVEAASTQINMIKEGNGKGIISKQMLSTIPNTLVCGKVLPKVEMEISLIMHKYEDLPIAAKELAEMILNTEKNASD